MFAAIVFVVLNQSAELSKVVEEANAPKFSIPRPVHEPVNISKTPYDPPPTSKR